MNVKVEVVSGNAIKDLNRRVESVLGVVPAEHLRGLSKIVIVDAIMEPRLTASQRATLPALYHPKMAGQSAWGEISLGVLVPKEKFPKRLLTRLALKSNLAQVVLSLVAQHYQLTLSKGVKKTLLEPAIKSYVERHFEKWREKEGGLRVKLLKPFKPQLDRLARRLARKYKDELAKK
ncbi:MAG TPA: hypothetical protein VLM38_24460 [Blastocatellia bacterium]|nr:hypothetical protein [Blastocatellia bacterium]